MTGEKMPEVIDQIKRVKASRQALDMELQFVRALTASREGSLAITRIQEAIMWLGMELKRINDGQSCYKEGYNPENATVEPTADGLKM